MSCTVCSGKNFLVQSLFHAHILHFKKRSLVLAVNYKRTCSKIPLDFVLRAPILFTQMLKQMYVYNFLLSACYVYVTRKLPTSRNHDGLIFFSSTRITHFSAHHYKIPFLTETLSTERSFTKVMFWKCLTYLLCI